MADKSFIEHSFPVREVSEESAKEKSIRHGHISTLHPWWARRPLASSRATMYAALTPDPKSEQERIRRNSFIHELAKWDNLNEGHFISKARKEILAANNGKEPKVLDPFAGGGSIPLEAIRLGCETYSTDLNPVAVLIEQATLIYPQKYGKKVKVSEITEVGTADRIINNKLIEDLRKASGTILSEVKKDIAQFYPEDSDGCIPIAYIWARTIKCNNPKCQAEIPLIKQLWLSNKEKKKIALRLSAQNRKIMFDIVENEEIDFDPSEGTIRKAKVICPCCGSGISDKELRKKFMEGNSGQRMIAVVTGNPKVKGKNYRLPEKKDVDAFDQAEDMLQEKRRRLFIDWDIDPVPDEAIITPTGNEYFSGGLLYNYTPVVLYGMTKWRDLYNSRQKLALITFVEKIKNYVEQLNNHVDFEYKKALICYLALSFDRLAAYCSTLGYWHVTGEKLSPAMQRQAIAMVFDYGECNPLSSNFSWSTNFEWVVRVIEHCSNNITNYASVGQHSATKLPFENDYFDAIFTDPPYYDNVPYSNLSDYYYIWLKRLLKDYFPDIFATPLSPKTDEVIDDLSLLRGMSKKEAVGLDGVFVKDKLQFEALITQAFSEMYRTLKPDGIAVIVFAHKSTDAWETIINALIKSGLFLTASWPINTEMKARLRAKDSAALASSIYMVCRKRVNNETAYFNEIKVQLENRIHEKLDQFWNEGISGSDFFVSAIGPAMEVFGRYEKVETFSGEEVTAKELMELIRSIVSEYALSKILKNVQLSGIDSDTRFYLLWRWAFKSAKIPFDEARKLGNAVGVELSEQWNKGVIKKDKEFIQVLGPKERGNNFLEQSKYITMVDVLHACLLMWEKNQRQAITEVLEESGYINNNAFWQLAQSISEVLPSGDKEKQMLQGFLYGRDGLTSDKQGGQQKLF